MSLRQTLWFMAGYVALIALSVWFNVSVLCSADAKYDRGCGGLGVYIPLWEIFLTPLALAAIGLERWRRATVPTTRRILIYLAGIFVIYQIGWRLERFPQLLALEAIAIALAAAVRWKVAARRPTERDDG
jgi:hypothetical protein